MKKLLIVLGSAAILAACGKKPAEDIAGSYSGSFAIADTASGQADVSVTAIGDDVVRLNMIMPGLSPVMLNGVAVNEQTHNHFGMAFTNVSGDVLVGSVDDEFHMIFQYTQGDTLFYSFSGNRTN